MDTLHLARRIRCRSIDLDPDHVQTNRVNSAKRGPHAAGFNGDSTSEIGDMRETPAQGLSAQGFCAWNHGVGTELFTATLSKVAPIIPLTIGPLWQLGRIARVCTFLFSRVGGDESVYGSPVSGLLYDP